MQPFVSRTISIAPLVTFRILFGVMMFLGVLRFGFNGWIYQQYVQPVFYFSYFGFEWVKPLSEQGMYVVFAAMAVSFLMLALGLFYRLSSIAAFLLFSYVELLDKTNYLNHYYFISIVCFVLIFVPAGKAFSLDVRWKITKPLSQVPLWTVGALRLQLGMVYFFAGLAKVNYEWLFEALPLKIWLPPHSSLPLVGFLMDKTWVAYFFSWFGCVYDISIPFLLLNSKTRKYAYVFVIIFHVATSALFPIGMFPYIMILSTLIFFSAPQHERWLYMMGWKKSIALHKPEPIQWKWRLLQLHFMIQLLLPFRYLLYPGKLFWTEQGYRFSWRVMLMEKAGTALFYVRDTENNKELEVDNKEFLTPQQEKMMATQPDMILQYAHFLKDVYKNRGVANPSVRVFSYVSLNGNRSQPFINPHTDLTREKESFAPKNWILPYNNDAK